MNTGKPPTQTLSARIPRLHHRALRLEAALRNVDIQDIVAEAIATHLKAWFKTHPELWAQLADDEGA